jgi:hypothetical protein
MKKGSEQLDEIVLKVLNNDSTDVDYANLRTLQCNFQDLIFNDRQCKVLSIRDITEINNYVKVQAENRMLSLHTSSVSHEMITPLKCIVKLGRDLAKSNDPRISRQAGLIVSTSGLILQQVKLILDKNMLDNNSFTPNFEFHSLNKTISEVA